MSAPLKNKKVSTYSVCGYLLSAGESVDVPESKLGDWEQRLVKAGKLRILKTARPGIVQVLHVFR